MPVTNYYSVGGEIFGEETGGVRRDYLTDALGSVTGTVTSAGAIENTYRYKPYGAQLSKTGSGSDPAFTWVGKWGYRQTNKNYSDVYVRARHYAREIGIWTSSDRIGFIIGPSLWKYADSNPIKFVDFTGNRPCCCCPSGLSIKEINRSTIFPNERSDIAINARVDLRADFSVNYIDYKRLNVPNIVDCHLEWWEKSTQDFHICPKNTWCLASEYSQDLTILKYNYYGEETGFNQCKRRGKCGPCSNWMYDPPSLSKSSRYRKLCILVKIRQFPGCPCSGAKLSNQVTARVVVIFDWSLYSGRGTAENVITVKNDDPYCDWGNAKK